MDYRLLRTRGLAMLGFTVLCLLGGCTELATASPPLAHARRSPEALARAALQAISAGDPEQLARLRISRHEYENLLWPVLPDRHQMPFDFVWSITGPRSLEAGRAAIRQYRGLPLELERVELGEDVERYQEFTLYRRSRMLVRRTDTGQVGVLPLMDALVELEGGWKFVNFVDKG